MPKMKIAVTGAAGRMGRELVKAIHGRDDCALVGAIEQEGSIAVGQDVGLLAGLGKVGVVITDEPLDVFAKADAVLDFTAPKATVEFAGLAANARNVFVYGTTGLNKEDEAGIAAAARHATIVTAGNMSLGVNLLTALTRKVAAALDPDFDIEVLEIHHRHKVDAPSGTALMLGRAAAEGRGVKLESASARARDGHTGARRRGDIGFAVLRGGSNVGEHSVIFAADGETVELTHRATNRDIFAGGALHVARRLASRPAGRYRVADLL